MAKDLYIGGAAQIKAYRILQTNVAEAVKSFGLGSVSEWLMLCHIYYNQNVMARELAELLEVEAPLATRLVANLQQAGLVASRPHPTDKRVKFLNATPEAKKLIDKVEAMLEYRLTKLLKGVDEAELKTYQKVLSAIISNGS